MRRNGTLNSVLFPDTSLRGACIEGEDDDWDSRIDRRLFQSDVQIDGGDSRRGVLPQRDEFQIPTALQHLTHVTLEPLRVIKAAGIPVVHPSPPTEKSHPTSWPTSRTLPASRYLVTPWAATAPSRLSRLQDEAIQIRVRVRPRLRPEQISVGRKDPPLILAGRRYRGEGFVRCNGVHRELHAWRFAG